MTLRWIDKSSRQMWIIGSYLVCVQQFQIREEFFLACAGVDCQIHASLGGFDNPAKPYRELLVYVYGICQSLAS